MNWLDHIPEIEETEANVRKSRANFLLRESFIFFILDKETGAYIGTCSLIRIDWNVRKFEVGYWLRNSASGNGYMTEAVNGLTEYIFDYFAANRVEILCDTLNIASRKVAERCRFILKPY